MQEIELVALQLDRKIALDALSGERGVEAAEDAFDQALDNLDIRNAHCSSRLDHAYLISQVTRSIGNLNDCAMVLAMGLRPSLMSSLLTLVLELPEKVRSSCQGLE
jgi:hypothetical protein